EEAFDLAQLEIELERSRRDLCAALNHRVVSLPPPLSPVLGREGLGVRGSSSDPAPDPSPAPDSDFPEPSLPLTLDPSPPRRVRGEEKAPDPHLFRFLGRGVSGKLGDFRHDAGRLEAFGLPILTTPFDLAERAGVRPETLR